MEAKKFNIDVIPKDKIVSVEISGYFYERLSSHVMHYLSTLSEDKINKSFQMIQDDVAHLDPVAFNLQTLFTLLHSIEDTFDKKGFRTKEEIEVTPKDQDIDEEDDDSKTED